MTAKQRICVLVALWLQAAEAAKILVFIPIPMKSHHFAFQPIVRELAERGHEVTYLTAVPMEKPLPKSVRQVMVPNVLHALHHDVRPAFLSLGQLSTPVVSWCMCKVSRAIMDATLSQLEAQKIIHSDEKYDLVIHEAFVLSEPVVALQHKFKEKITADSSTKALAGPMFFLFLEQLELPLVRGSLGLFTRDIFPYMTESLIATTVSKVLKNSSYKTEAMRRSELFRDRIMRPVEEAVYWTEYVLKHGKVLQPASARMPFYQVYLLDVIATIVVGLLVVLYITRKILCLVWSLIRGNKHQTVQGQQKTQATKKKSKND